MSVKIRLARRGRKKLALYDIVVADSKAPRDGRFIAKLGTYNPNTNPATLVLNDAEALKWVLSGALPTDTARNLLSEKGIMLKKHLQVGVLKGAITQDQADKKFNEWLKSKEAKSSDKVADLQKKKAADKKAKLEAESKVNESRKEAQKTKAAQATFAGTEEAAPAEASAEGQESAEANG
ncbi:MAG: 30S ribosomal protein S16 [Cytophagaceae bacterium]